jgi:hypothetical protein
MGTRIGSLFFTFLLFLATAQAQGWNEEWSVRESEATITFCGPEAGPIIAEQPYSADQVEDYTHTLGERQTENGAGA